MLAADVRASSCRLRPTRSRNWRRRSKRPGIHLGVWPEGGTLRVWGTTRALPPFCFVLEVVAPGLLVVKHPQRHAGKFVNVAVLEGDQVKIVDEQSANLPDCPGLVTSLLGFESPDSWRRRRQCPRADRRVDARARPRRRAAGRAVGLDRWRRVDRPADRSTW